MGKKHGLEGGEGRLLHLKGRGAEGIYSGWGGAK